MIVLLLFSASFFRPLFPLPFVLPFPFFFPLCFSSFLLFLYCSVFVFVCPGSFVFYVLFLLFSVYSIPFFLLSFPFSLISFFFIGISGILWKWCHVVLNKVQKRSRTGVVPFGITKNRNMFAIIPSVSIFQTYGVPLWSTVWVSFLFRPSAWFKTSGACQHLHILALFRVWVVDQNTP